MGAGLRRPESLRIGDPMVRLAGLGCKNPLRKTTGSYSDQEQISRSQTSRRCCAVSRPTHAFDQRSPLVEPRHEAYTPPYTDNPRIALQPITQSKIFLLAAQQL